MSLNQLKERYADLTNQFQLLEGTQWGDFIKQDLEALKIEIEIGQKQMELTKSVK